MRSEMNGRLRAFSGDREAAVRAGKWLKASLGDPAAKAWCESRGLLTRAQSESINSAGGALVADELASEIISLLPLAGVFAREARPASMGRDVMNTPRRAGGLT